MKILLDGNDFRKLVLGEVVSHSFQKSYIVEIALSDIGIHEMANAIIELKIKMEEKMKPDCRNCKHKVIIAGDCHIGCSNPDNNIKLNPHGVRNGWCFYPINFDPVWLDSQCKNFKHVDGDACE